jgi:DNA modification methylase
MKINCLYDKLVPIAELKPHPRNRNSHPDDQLTRLAQILEYQGWRYPVKVSKLSGFITSGHGRVLAAKKAGFKTVPVNFQEYESEAQEYADITADNAIALWSELDLSGIKDDITKLPDLNLKMLGIKEFSIEPEVVEGQCDEDEVPEHVEPKTKLGDLYILGEHRLLCGDSTNIQHVERLMDGKKAQTFFSDPPYGDNVGGLRTKTGADKAKAVKAGKGLVDRVSFIANDLEIDWLEEVFNLVPAFLEDDATKMVFFKWDRFQQIKKMAVAFGEPSALCVWDRVRKASAFFRFQPQHELCFHWGNQADKKEPASLSNVWRVPKELENNELHPTVKPIAIIEPAIRVTTDLQKIVLDLFGGSGSTLIACEKTQRKCFMMELDPKYCDVIVARWEKYTGKKATLLVS